MAEGFHSVADIKTLEQVLTRALVHDEVPKKNGDTLDPAFHNFASQLVRFATGEDQYWDEPEALLSRIIENWQTGTRRQAGEPIVKLRVRDDGDWRTKRLVLTIVTDDKPFLVDSVSAMLADAGKPVSFFNNAVVETFRDAKGHRTSHGTSIRESLILAEMDPPIDDEEIELLHTELATVLADVNCAVEDWEPMRARLGSCIAQLERSRPENVDRDDLREAVRFLKWLWDNRFAFLGVRRYSYHKSDNGAQFQHDPADDLGILKDQSRRILKSTFVSGGSLSPAVKDFMDSNEPIIVAKANARSTVHRRTYMDYIGVKTYSPDGQVVGEERYVGLFTSEAYNRPASDIPLLNRKVDEVIHSAKFAPGSHNEKAIANILETFPRDEMFQTDVETLRETSLGILRLYKRPRTKLFLRRDRFDRFVSAIVFVPRDRFSSEIRENIGAVLATGFNGRVSAFYPYFGDASLIRVHFIIGMDPGAPEGRDLRELTRQIRTITKSWADGLLDEMRAQSDGKTPHGLFARYENAFDAGYVHRTTPIEAITDIEQLQKLDKTDIRQRVFHQTGSAKNTINLKMYSANRPLPLSDMIPRIENLGLKILREQSAQVNTNDGRELWIHNFHTVTADGQPINADEIGTLLEDALTAIVNGKTEDDCFNSLIALAGLDWREAWALRALAKHHLQAGYSFSQSYIEDTLVNNPQITRSLISLFHSKFNPLGTENLHDRMQEVEQAKKKIFTLLEEVASLDEDRIIRRFIGLINAISRTNYYQRDDNGEYKPYISLKIESPRLPELPDPKPYREIFVSGPRVDGVHLRFGPIARGGLRWSDRREDFRTEVLGLVKAQRVKNAVIVPTGSKGGFYPKQLPASGERTEIFEEGRNAYKQFIRGLLDVTDNIVDGRTVAPTNVVRWDDDDPYLVVAADKGTATFSDTANDISRDYGFWLGDAFASGGTNGYDHKVMGITARGAWEAVKRHFREAGKNIQSEPFTVAGVGDMSGDVFGNGMLLSEKIKLVAAFDHRDIFIDPTPDPATSFEERKRLFNLPRSSWQDYDKSLISRGGNIFSRAKKEISLSEEIKSLLGLDTKKVTPNELIKAIIKAPVELFWLGGIGTYFKAPHEENWRVGDRANDAVRINANEMKCAVVGEGANLGLTQEARIIFAKNGGRVNTDAVDNSAGVDSSDHEVNIKILLSRAIEKAELKDTDRDSLLKEMTSDVADHVLRHNYDQTRAISQMSFTAARDLETYARLMDDLEEAGKLDRAIENLPDEKELSLRAAHGRGLTRPELSVLLAYSKMDLFDGLIASPAPDDPALDRALFQYFPTATHAFTQAIVDHRLRREIIATRLANEIIDTCGATFVHKIAEQSGAGTANIALAYEAARQILDLGDFATAVNDLDNKALSGVQINLYNAASDLMAEQVYKIVSDVSAKSALQHRGIKGLVDQYQAPFQSLKAALPAVLSPRAVEALEARSIAWHEAGAPQDVAQSAAFMSSLEFAFDIVNLASDKNWTPRNTAAIFFAVGEQLQIDMARDAARLTPQAGHFDRLATFRLVEDLSIRQAAISGNIIATCKSEPTSDDTQWLAPLLTKWQSDYGDIISRHKEFASQLNFDNDVTVGKLSLFNQKLLELIEHTR